MARCAHVRYCNLDSLSLSATAVELPAKAYFLNLRFHNFGNFGDIDSTPTSLYFVMYVIEL